MSADASTLPSAPIPEGLAAGPSVAPSDPAMSSRAVNWAMTGLALSLFVAGVSNLVVLTALPRIVSDLHGTQAAYTWIITSSMLTITVCSPIWGRMSDVLDKKLLIQICVAGYVLASICAGLAGSTWVIIGCRVVIGVCAAGIIVLMQSISLEITTPRQRARWIGYRGAVMSVATVGAPSLGGFVTQHFGWRACFFVGLPLAIVSIAMVRNTLKLLPVEKGKAAGVDWWGALLLGGGVVLIMIWISVIGPSNGWISPPALATLLSGLAILAVATVFELRARKPMLPLELFKELNVLLCSLAGAGTGVAFFGSAVFLAIYLQIGRGFSPQIAGLMALPEAAGTLTASLTVSHFIAKAGRYKAYLILGAVMVTSGFGLMSLISTSTPMLFVGLCVALIGAGLGTVSENLVLVVQTTVDRSSAGSAGALVVFFRMLGGVLCVAILGAILSSHVSSEVQARGLVHFDARVVPKLATLSASARAIMETAYAHGAALVYLACVPTSLMMLLCVCLLRERELEPSPAKPD